MVHVTYVVPVVPLAFGPHDLNATSSAPIIRARDNAVRWAAMHLPTFHTFGFYIQLYYPLVSGYSVCVYTPQAPHSPVVPYPRNVLDTCRVCGVSGIPTVPAFIDVSHTCMCQVKTNLVYHRRGHSRRTLSNI